MSAATRLDRCLAWFHRWAGIVLSVLFFAWFASGIILLYVPFPALSEQARLADSESIDVTRVVVSPATALASLPQSEELALISVAGRPVYLAFSASGAVVAVGADDGRRLGFFSADVAKTVAERFSRVSAQATAGPLQYDQWTVHQRLDPYRPFYRLRLSDGRGTDLYVSARTGQVLQRTNARERAWNWCGAVLHWIYFTPLRQSYWAWNEVVWWLSLAALATSVVGTWLGIDRSIKARHLTRPRWSPFRIAWMRWHHVFGLLASAVVLVWIFSGWLSMDHGRLFSVGQPPAEIARRFRGVSLAEVTRAVPADFMRRIGMASEVRFNAVARYPFIAAIGKSRQNGQVVWLDRSIGVPSTTVIPDSLLVSALGAALGGGFRIATVDTPGPDFYALAESLDANANPLVATGPQVLRVYVDRVSGKILVVMDASRRGYAWFYYALHTFNFPALLGHPGVRDVIVSTMMLFGLGFVLTGVVIGYQRLVKTSTR